MGLKIENTRLVKVTKFYFDSSKVFFLLSMKQYIVHGGEQAHRTSFDVQIFV